MRIAWLVLAVVLMASCQFLQPTEVEPPTDDPVKVAEQAEASARTDIVVDRITKIESGMIKANQGVAKANRRIDQVNSDTHLMRDDIAYLDQAVASLQNSDLEATGEGEDAAGASATDDPSPVDKGGWTGTIVWMSILLVFAGVMAWRRWRV